MGDILLITATFLAGAAAGALITRTRDRRLLRLYGELVRLFSRMLRQQLPAQQSNLGVTAREAELHPPLLTSGPRVF